MQTYHIALCSNAAYVPYALVTMHSIMAHHQLEVDETFHFHLITEQEIKGRNDVQEFLATYPSAKLTSVRLRRKNLIYHSQVFTFQIKGK